MRIAIAASGMADQGINTLFSHRHLIMGAARNEDSTGRSST